MERSARFRGDNPYRLLRRNSCSTTRLSAMLHPAAIQAQDSRIRSMCRKLRRATQKRGERLRRRRGISRRVCRRLQFSQRRALHCTASCWAVCIDWRGREGSSAHASHARPACSLRLQSPKLSDMIAQLWSHPPVKQDHEQISSRWGGGATYVTLCNLRAPMLFLNELRTSLSGLLT